MFLHFCFLPYFFEDLMNSRVRTHIVQEETYIPEIFSYPQVPDAQFIKTVKVRDVDVENGYPFLDKSLKSRLMGFLINAGIHLLVYPVSKIIYGLKIEGQENIKKNRKLLKNGAMTVCNHVHRWDFCFVLMASKKFRMWFPAKASNLETKDAVLIRGAGGIPVPQTLGAVRHFNETFDSLAKKKKWLHVFPEAARWDYYEPVRPFKKGGFKMALRYGYPIIPMAISFRERKGFRKLFMKDKPLITIKIGTVILPEQNENATKNEAADLLRKNTHAEICRLAGIKQNCWEAEGD